MTLPEKVISSEDAELEPMVKDIILDRRNLVGLNRRDVCMCTL